MVPDSIRELFCGLFSLVLPDDCRVCGEPLTNVSRIPVCLKCLDAPRPMAAEYACSRCGAAFTSGHPLDESGRCAICRRGIGGFDAAYSYGYYEGELRELVRVFKYEKVETLATPLAKRMLAAMPKHHPVDVIVPVPVHWRKKLSRGFNQAELLGKELGRRMLLPVRQVLRRSGGAVSQASLSLSKRRASMRQGAFTVTRPADVAGRRVLLVDDVFTTGATARACARELKRVGAAHVTLLTLARVDRRPVAIPGRARTTAASTGGNRTE